MVTPRSAPDPRAIRAGHNGVLKVLDDDTDRLIAAALVADGRTTLKTLSEATGLSVSAVQARVRRLDAEGVIQGYTALIDPQAIGLPLAAIVGITPLDPGRHDDIPARIAGLSAVESCHSVSGEDSFVLFVRVASPRALEGLVQKIRRRVNVSTRTTVVLQTFFERRAHPVVAVGSTGRHPEHSRSDLPSVMVS